MLALCALAPVGPGMSKADHWQICGQTSRAETIRCAKVAWTGSENFLTRKRSSYTKSWKWKCQQDSERASNKRLHALQTVALTSSFPNFVSFLPIGISFVSLGLL